MGADLEMPRAPAPESLLIGSFFILAHPIGAPHAEAVARHGLPVPLSVYNHYRGELALAHGCRSRTSVPAANAASGLSCVPFARSDIPASRRRERPGNGGTTLPASTPAAGALRQAAMLTFRSNGRMRLGHVAVVSRVINPREIESKLHANWWVPAHTAALRNIPVVDVSGASDWTAGARRPWPDPATTAASTRPTALSTIGPTMGRWWRRSGPAGH